MIRAAILTESGSKAGYGHLMRSVAFAEAMERMGAAVDLYVSTDQKVRCEKIVGGFRTINYLSWKSDAFLLNNPEKYEIIFVDVPGILNRRTLNKILPLDSVFVIVDDNGRVDSNNSIVINGNIHSNLMEYDRKKNNLYLTGTAFVMQRRVFWSLPSKVINERVKNIVVSLGGSNQKGNLAKVLSSLQFHFPGLEKHVVGLSVLPDSLENASDRVHLYDFLDSLSMVKLFFQADIVITAAGQTLYEIARCGVPAVSVVVADDQVLQASAFDKAELIPCAGDIKNPSTLDKLIYLTKKTIEDIQLRKRMSSRLRNLVDGKGVLRVAIAAIVAAKLRRAKRRGLLKGCIFMCSEQPYYSGSDACITVACDTRECYENCVKAVTSLDEFHNIASQFLHVVKRKNAERIGKFCMKI